MLFLNAWDCFQGDGTNGGKRKRRRKKKNGRKKRIDRERERRGHVTPFTIFRRVPTTNCPRLTSVVRSLFKRISSVAKIK